MNDRQKTFEKFGFKTVEKQDNIQLKPVIKEFTGGDAKGTMSISDLWSDKNIKKYLHDCKLVKYIFIYIIILYYYIIFIIGIK